MSRRSLGLLCLLFSLPVALVVTEIRQYARNTLSENGNWVSAKTLMQIPLLGSGHFVGTRHALARNRLDLRAWHGYNEVYFHRPVELERLSFRFRLEEGAHLSTVLCRTETGFAGLRFSRHPALTAAVITGRRSGRFTSKTPLLVDTGPGWHRARIERRDGLWHLELDGFPSDPLTVEVEGPGLVGFRSGLRGVEIDDIEIHQVDGTVAIRESFRHNRGFVRDFLTSFGAILVGLVLVAWLADRWQQAESPAPAYWVALVALMALLGAVGFLAFDVYVWSDSYSHQVRHARAPTPPELLLHLESWRRRAFGVRSPGKIDLPVGETARRLTGWDLASEFVRPGPNPWNGFAAYGTSSRGRPRYLSDEQILSRQRKAGIVRIAFIGTSQTLGAGADTVSNAMVSHFHRSLTRRLGSGWNGSKPGVEAYNLSIPGSWGAELLREYRQRWIDLEPDLAVINLGHNGYRVARLEKSLERFVDLHRSHGTGSVFVVEPIAPDYADPGVRQRQDVMRTTGRRLDVPVLDLEAQMSRPDIRDSGFIWWDRVHLTSYGQALAGDWIAEQIAAILPDELQTPEARDDVATRAGRVDGPAPRRP